MPSKHVITSAVLGLSLLLFSGCSWFSSGNDYEGDASVCPTNGPFEVGYDSPQRYCECPEGYTKDSRMVGEQSCYDNATCPIVEVECVEE